MLVQVVIQGSGARDIYKTFVTRVGQEQFVKLTTS